MITTQRTIEEIRLHREDLMRAAARERLASEVRKSQPKSAPVHARLLLRAGQRMVETGSILQARYGQLTEKSTPMSGLPESRPA